MCCSSSRLYSSVCSHTLQYYDIPPASYEAALTPTGHEDKHQATDTAAHTKGSKQGSPSLQTNLVLEGTLIPTVSPGPLELFSESPPVYRNNNEDMFAVCVLYHMFSPCLPGLLLDSSVSSHLPETYW